MSPHCWPDTTGQPPPRDHHHAAALWMLGRHQQLADLVARVPEAIDWEDGEPFLELSAISDALAAFDLLNAPGKEPKLTQAQRLAGSSVGQMSGSERTRLRLLAFWSPGGVRIRAADLISLDAEGQRLVADWCAAVRVS